MAIPITTRSKHVAALTDLFLATPIGGVVTFEQMSKATRMIKDHYGHLIPAVRKRTSRQAGALFESVRTIGYKRKPAEETSHVGAHTRRRMRSTCKTNENYMINSLRFANDISDVARRRAYGEINGLQLARELLTDKVHESVPATPRPQSVALTLAAMMGQIASAPAADTDTTA